MRHKPWHCSGRMGTPNKSYSEQIDLHRFEHLLTPRPAKLFHWSGQKHTKREPQSLGVWLESVVIGRAMTDQHHRARSTFARAKP